MAEVIPIPKVGGENSSLTREHSSLSRDFSQGEKQAIEKVELKGSVKTKKVGFGQKLKETFIADDARDVGDYILWDIIIPTIRRTIRDVIVGSADRIFLGAGAAPSSGSSLYREHGVTYVKARNDYASISARKVQPRALPATTQPASRYNMHLDDIVFEYYEDAAAVLERMVDYLETYGKVSVDDYFDLCGKSSPYTTQAWGWTSLTNATIINTVGGYFIKLPNPVVIKE